MFPTGSHGVFSSSSPEYAKVQAVTVLDNRLNDELAITTGEILVMRDWVNQFILWYLQDIILTIAPHTHQTNK